MHPRKAIYPRNPHALYKEHGYSPAIQSDDLLFVSGMVGARPDGTAEPDLEKQVEMAFSQLLEVLDAAGCTFDNVGDVTMFLVKPEEILGVLLPAMRKVYRDPLPNITAVGVTWLSGFLFEIKVIARVPPAKCAARP